MARIFRPTLLAVFEITNTELGSYFSIYGIVAMVSYFFGGPLADRYSSRNLMAIALSLTAFGGFVMAMIPSSGIMLGLYAFWGFTTIFLFWSALIRATREWGGSDFQGRAFGWLEGGRGLTAALLGTFTLVLFSNFMPTDFDVVLTEKRIQAFQPVILAIAIITLLSGMLIWFFVPRTSSNLGSSNINIRKVMQLMQKPSIWMLAIIIVCAYVGYKITDDFSLYAKEVLGFNEVSAAGLGTAALWMRAVVAIAAGYLADRINGTKVISVCFALSASGGMLIGFGSLENIISLVLLNLALTMAGVYGVRSLYFALMPNARVPLSNTGTAVGIVSVVGFTPDIFMSPWMGHLLDKYPGATGHQYVFLVLVLFSVVGFITSLIFRRRYA